MQRCAPKTYEVNKLLHLKVLVIHHECHNGCSLVPEHLKVQIQKSFAVFPAGETAIKTPKQQLMKTRTRVTVDQL